MNKVFITLNKVFITLNKVFITLHKVFITMNNPVIKMVLKFPKANLYLCKQFFQLFYDIYI